ncbi:RNA polymerase subunit AC19 [Savitreella phatthalungensis]
MEGRAYANPVSGPRFKTLPGAALDGTASTFQFAGEDHTLGNALRYVVMKNERVEFCGYSIPHPSEPFMNLRIQTYAYGNADMPATAPRNKEEEEVGPYTAITALEKGLDDLLAMAQHIRTTFIDEAEAIIGAGSDMETG